MSARTFSMSLEFRGRVLAALVIAALLVVTGGYFWGVARGVIVHSISVSFLAPSAAGMHAGEQVRLSGVRIGKIADIVLDPDASVAVRLEIEKHYLPMLHGDAQVSTDSESLLGDSYLSITTGTERGGALTDGRTLRFVAHGSLQEARELPRQISETLQRIDALATTLNNPDGDLRSDLHDAHQLIIELRATRALLDTTLAGIDRLTRERVPQTLAHLDDTLVDARRDLSTINQTLTRLDSSGTRTLQDYRQVASELRARLAKVQTLLDTTQPQIETLLQSSQGLTRDADTAVNSLRKHWPFSSTSPAPPVAAPADQPSPQPSTAGVPPATAPETP